MYAYIYLSKALETFDRSQLIELEQRAARKNRMLGVTGYLHYSQLNFVQYLEGEKASVARLISEIEQDPRHNILYKIESDDLSDRRFPRWSMKVLPPTYREINLDLLFQRHIYHLIELAERGLTDHGQLNEKMTWEIADKLAKFNGQLELGNQG